MKKKLFLSYGPHCIFAVAVLCLCAACVINPDNGGDDQGDNNSNTPAITWAYVTDSPFGSSSITRIVYGAGKFLAVGDYGKKMAYSVDGISWTAVASPFSEDQMLVAIAYGDGKFVAAGTYYNDYYANVSYSTDGITWTAPVSPGISISSYDMAYGGGRFVIGRAPNMAYSTDGHTWTMASTDDFSSYPYLNLECIAYGNGRFVAGGNSGSAKGKIAYSDNGETWMLVEDGIIDTDNYVKDIAYGNGKFVKVGGTIAYSVDGLNWKATNTTGIYGIAYGGGKFVSFSLNSTVLSDDGVIWTNTNDNYFYSKSTIYAIAYGGAAGSGRFVLGTATGDIFYSNIQE